MKAATICHFLLDRLKDAKFCRLVSSIIFVASSLRHMDLQEVVVQYRDSGHGNDKRRLVVTGASVC